MAVPTTTQVLYADLDDLRTVVREETLLECLDWNRDGQVDDAAALSVCLEPASADIDAFFMTEAGILMPLQPPYPPVLKYIALDGCQWRLCAKYPAIYSVDVAALQKRVKDTLIETRKGMRGLGQKPPEPNAVHGGRVFQNVKVNGNPKGPIFGNGGKWGIF